MSDMKSVPGILEVIKSITSNGETGRLELDSSGMRGTLLFYEGKLVDARLGSLSGFQAVNAAVALRDAQFNFDHVEPASHVSTITPNERVVLKRFFGIEAAEIEEPRDTVESEIDWNPAPEPVVPLTEAETIPLAFFSKPRIAVVCLALLLGLAVGAVAFRSKMKTPQQPASVAGAVESESSADPAAQPEVRQAAVAPASSNASEQHNRTVKSVAASPVVSAARRQSGERDENVQDLTGEWRVINTIERTAYKSFNNMEVGFRLTINQKGKEFTAQGEKFSENGQTLPAASRTPIRVTGSIDGDKVVATFVEDGRMRRTNGQFVWRLQSGGDGLAGTFVSTAANSSGKSAVIKEQ